MADIFENFEQYILDLPLANVEYSFPAVKKYGAVGNPQAIFVQTPLSNTDNIFIGKTGVKADFTTGAFILPSGGDAIPPFNGDETLKAISPVAGQKLFVTYLSGIVK